MELQKFHISIIQDVIGNVKNERYLAVGSFLNVLIDRLPRDFFLTLVYNK